MHNFYYESAMLVKDGVIDHWSLSPCAQHSAPVIQTKHTLWVFLFCLGLFVLTVCPVDMCQTSQY